jgi:hypothetical protein
MNRSALHLGIALVLSALAGACSSDATEDHGVTHDDGGATDSSTTPTPSPTDGGAGSDGSVAPLAAPTISGIAKMAGGLHVMWKNAQKDCDKVEGERKTGTEAYKIAFSVPGVADNKHDAVGLTAGTEYTYRLRCVKGDTVSEYSAAPTSRHSLARARRGTEARSQRSRPRSASSTVDGLARTSTLPSNQSGSSGRRRTTGANGPPSAADGSADTIDKVKSAAAATRTARRRVMRLFMSRSCGSLALVA